jgi:hypothetical protein
MDSCEIFNQIIFESITRKLCVGVNGHKYTDVCRTTFSGVVDELFADRHYKWGRIATVFAFAGWWARSGATGNPKNGFRPDVWADTVAEVAGDYLAEKLCAWVLQQGGWVGIHFYFSMWVVGNSCYLCSTLLFN